MTFLRTWTNMKDIIARTCRTLGVNRDHAEMIIAALLERPRHELYRSTRPLDAHTLHIRLVQIAKQIPLEYLTKKTYFRDLDLCIQPGVFIPRVETEYLIDIVLREVNGPPRRILDIGTGSGAIAITLARYFPQASVIATDISPAAIRCARKNIRAHDLESRIGLVRSSLFAGLTGDFDLIVSNPPYIPRERIPSLPPSVREYEPLLALDGGPRGIRIIEKIISQAIRHIRAKGLIALEIDDGEESHVQGMLEQERDMSCTVHTDLFGKQRYILITRTGP